ncbi:MAG: dynamin family protein [Candidatus Brocadiae bacterium]|nr:dynamin family protein [Candidatus Brocadiia bacterium]
MANLKEVCQELISYSDDLKSFWDELWRSWKSIVSQSLYNQEVSKIEKFQSYDCRPSFRIGFVGEQSCGKSIFINELVQKDIVLSGAAEVTFVPTVISLCDEDTFSFHYYTQKEIEAAIAPYYEYYTRPEIEIHLDNYKRQSVYNPKLNRDYFLSIKDCNSLKSLDPDVLKALYYCLHEVTKDAKIAKDFIHLVYAIQNPGLYAKLSTTDNRLTTPTSFQEIKRRSSLLKSVENESLFPEYDRNKKDFYEIYLIHHIYQTVRYSEKAMSRMSYLEFVDLPGIDAITIRVRHASLFFLKEVDALMLLTDTQKSLTLSGQEILRTLRGNRQKTDLDECLFIAINKYDTINAASVKEGSDLESFKHTVNHIRNNIRYVLGDTKLQIFVASALMSQFYRREKENALEASNQAKLKAFLAMKENPNLSGDSNIDTQIKRLFEDNNFGGIPQIRKEIEEYLQNVSLKLKKRFFLQMIEGFWKDINQVFAPVCQESIQKWQSRDQLDILQIRQNLLAPIQEALKNIDASILSVRDYLVPLDKFYETLKNEIEKWNISSNDLWARPKMDLYKEIHSHLLEVLRITTDRLLVQPYQEKLTVVVRQMMPIIDSVKRASSPVPFLKNTLDQIQFLVSLHPHLIRLRLEELVSEKPIHQLPSYLQSCTTLASFVSLKKAHFLRWIAPDNLVACTKIWGYSLYCMQEIQSLLKSLQQWTIAQTAFPEYLATDLSKSNPEDTRLQEEYKKAMALQTRATELEKKWKDLKERVLSATY